MKRKLKVVFILITLALLGIIIFQAYWSLNAYRFNKEKFDTNINTAMKKAVDDCKKDYSDSIRWVLIKRLSPPETTIKIDTVLQEKNIYKLAASGGTGVKSQADRIGFQIEKKMLAADLLIWISDKFTKPNQPLIIDAATFDFYKLKIITDAQSANSTAKILHQPDYAQVLTEIALNNRVVGKIVIDFLTRYDFKNRDARIAEFKKTHRVMPSDTILKFGNSVKNGVYVITPHFQSADSLALRRNFQRDAEKINSALQNAVFSLPPNLHASDSVRLTGHFRRELDEIHIQAPFALSLSQTRYIPLKSNLHHSETDIVEYGKQGLLFPPAFGVEIIIPDFFVHAVFNNPQYVILKSMLLTLLLSVFLILFTIFCFYYIIRTFISQKKLAGLKDDFINNMTHELKTPITTITVAVEGLQKFNALDDPEKTQRYLQTSRNELRRLNDLVTKVLDIAAFESKEIELLKEKINVNDLVDEVIISEKSKANKTINITFINKDHTEFIYADKIHFRNVLINLIDNAIKYSNEPVDIAVTCYKNENNLILSVKDNGPGIPAAHTRLIFDKFHRVPAGNIHAEKGTGLGLSYVKYIVEAHGGSIYVKSEINKGSEFIVSIPLSDG